MQGEKVPVAAMLALGQSRQIAISIRQKTANCFCFIIHIQHWRAEAQQAENKFREESSWFH
jgi:hypothetical protein